MIALFEFLYELSMETLWQDEHGWWSLPPSITGIPRDREAEARPASNSTMTITAVDWANRRITVTCS